MKTFIFRITRRGTDTLKVIRAKSRYLAMSIIAADFPGFDRITIMGESI